MAPWRWASWPRRCIRRSMTGRSSAPAWRRHGHETARRHRARGLAVGAGSRRLVRGGAGGMAGSGPCPGVDSAAGVVPVTRPSPACHRAARRTGNKRADCVTNPQDVCIAPHGGLAQRVESRLPCLLQHPYNNELPSVAPAVHRRPESRQLATDRPAPPRLLWSDVRRRVPAGAGAGGLAL
ncbi:hypothetical protein CBM2589_A80172 [Cupriavidus taiwanensis]|uniref:Uncharacterized protein n=1 Tax=Cupriavidus taiwanensis TaxID=164546 RepID=A0A375CBS2_9BURK|nr:hypothetical protein CBM2589_A80172 [Cupriavidus taiwanensis]